MSEEDKGEDEKRDDNLNILDMIKSMAKGSTIKRVKPNKFTESPKDNRVGINLMERMK
jgi:hypothetical protein